MAIKWLLENKIVIPFIVIWFVGYIVIIGSLEWLIENGRTASEASTMMTIALITWTIIYAVLIAVYALYKDSKEL